MARIFVDGKLLDARDGTNLLEAILSAGIDLPYFCWHPALGSVGACRQCAVRKFKDENDAKGRIVMACMEKVEDGLRVSVEDPEAAAFRAGVIEWLMTNHPHDCPICDEGGECHLQDMTVMTGHDYRRFRFKKRTFANQNLGPFINHEMNRCIVCFRCHRFYCEYAGGKDFAVLAGHNRTYFGRHRDGRLESEFSGNLVEVCPTGVFTDKTLKRHFTRKWDLRAAPSVCVHCGLGCNTIIGERYGLLRRVLNRYHPDVNGYFLCDRGRFGYEFVNGEKRIREPRLNGDADAVEAAAGGAAVGLAARVLSQSPRIVGIGSPRASLEANFVLKKLVGEENFFLGMADDEARRASLALGMMTSVSGGPASLKHVQESGAALVLGEDVTNYTPMLALAIRQMARGPSLAGARELGIPDWENDAVRHAARETKGPLFVASPSPTKLDDIASLAYRGAPADIAALGFAVAHALDPSAPAPENAGEGVRGAAAGIAEALRQAESPLVVAGLGSGEEAVLRAASNVVGALGSAGRRPRLCLTFPECNTVGLMLLGGRPLGELLEEAASRPPDAVIVVENDLFRRAAAEAVGECLGRCRRVIVLDHVANETTAAAHVLLPAAAFAESTGTIINNEGRAQRFFRAMVPGGEARESWRWIRDIGAALGRPEFEKTAGIDDLTGAMAAEVPALAGVEQAAPPASFRVYGQKLPRAPHRESGRTAVSADKDVSEPKPPDDPDSALSMTMEGRPGIPPAALTSFYWSSGWNSVQALNRYQTEIGGRLRGGTSGRRLIGGDRLPRPAYFSAKADAGPGEGEWAVFPVHHIFGSEELSSLAPAIGGIAPPSYLSLNSEDALALGIKDGAPVALEAGGRRLELPAKLEEGQARGTVGVPAGAAGLFRIRSAKTAVIRRARP